MSIYIMLYFNIYSITICIIYILSPLERAIVLTIVLQNTLRNVWVSEAIAPLILTALSGTVLIVRF